MPQFLCIVTLQPPIDGFDGDDLVWIGEKAPDLENVEQQITCMLAFAALAESENGAKECIREEIKTLATRVHSVECRRYPQDRFIRFARDFLRHQKTNAALRIGSAIAFDHRSEGAKCFAHEAIVTACLRRPWQFWR